LPCRLGSPPLIYIYTYIREDVVRQCPRERFFNFFISDERSNRCKPFVGGSTRIENGTDGLLVSVFVTVNSANSSWKRPRVSSSVTYRVNTIGNSSWPGLDSSHRGTWWAANIIPKRGHYKYNCRWPQNSIQTVYFDTIGGRESAAGWPILLSYFKNGFCWTRKSPWRRNVRDLWIERFW